MEGMGSALTEPESSDTIYCKHILLWKDVYTMKTTIKKMDYEKVMALPRPQHKLPRKPNLFWRCLIRFLTIFGMMGTRFQMLSLLACLRRTGSGKAV